MRKLIEDLNLGQKLFVCEFGAWDGKFASNTFNLVIKKNSVALMIEGDNENLKILEKHLNNIQILYQLTNLLNQSEIIH